MERSFHTICRDLLSQYGLGQKKINTILGKEDISDPERLDELLKEDDTLAECKSQNQKLMEFITRPENLVQVIRYATRMPQEGASDDQQRRFPFIASDVLTSSIKLAEALVPVKSVPPPLEEATEETDTTLETT
jgi:hypothetical protein